MDQIEKPLSILLIVAAVAYAFMYTDAGDGFTAIENNTAFGYTIKSAELSTGYNVNGSDVKYIEALKVLLESFEASSSDSIVQDTTDSLVVNIEGPAEEIEIEVGAEVINTNEE